MTNTERILAEIKVTDLTFADQLQIVTALHVMQKIVDGDYGEFAQTEVIKDVGTFVTEKYNKR